MSYFGTTPLFVPGPNPRAPALPWRSDDFFAVDDRVRGGSSHSHMGIVQYPPNSRGEIIFSGFLDTTTLGGAGFASQSSLKSFAVTLTKQDYQGLRIVARKEPSWSEPTPPSDGGHPGGGKGPVTSFVFLIKTEKPATRPDGRRESVIVWEWRLDIPQPGDQVTNTSLNMALTNDEFWVFDASWQDFKPFYRGKPVDPDTAGEFKPEATYEWSFMARSNFQTQSGLFALQLHSLSALPIEDQFTASSPHTPCAHPVQDAHEQERGAWTDEKADRSFRSSPPTMPALVIQAKGKSKGEYYGFALFIFATMMWIGWLFWALTPDDILQSVGIAWYPSRQWAFLIPAWSLFAVLAVYAVFIGLNANKTPELDDITNVTDTAQNVYRISMQDEKHLFEDDNRLKHSMHDIYDLPPTYVSRQVHFSRPEHSI